MVLKRFDRGKKRTILFGAEGHNETERRYFSSFNSDPQLKNLFDFKYAKGSKTDPVGVVEDLVRAMSRIKLSAEDGDLAFCLLDSDCDRSKDRQFVAAERLAAKYGIRLIVSSPCFEVWFLCHFLQTLPSYTNSSQVLAELSKHVRDYSKTKNNMYLLLGAKTGSAVKVAEKLERICLQQGRKLHTADFTPSTEVFKIIREIFPLAG